MTIKLLVFSPIKADGTSYYRGFGPLNHLAKVFDIQVTDATGLTATWDVISRYDVILLQRPSTFEDVAIMDLAAKCNRPVIIDYDDDYLSIPVTNPRYELYADPSRREQIKRCIELADRIITSTISIKESIVKHCGKDREKIQVIPNGVDETMFDLSPIEDLTERNVILWRGGDTHDKDMEPYIDKMVDLYNEFPHFQWAFMGHAPKSFMSKIDCNRIMLYPFEDVMTYLDRLFELKPTITLTPWEENDFNQGKSNCVWLESTLAGAPVVFPKWSTEFVEGMIGYNDPESFYKSAFVLLSSYSLREKTYSDSLVTLKNRFTLGHLNPTRINVIHDVMSERIDMGKLGCNHPKYKQAPVQYTDKQFYDYTWEHQLNQNFPNYAQAHGIVAEWLRDEFKVRSVVELGCGPGAMIEKFCELRVPQVMGVEMNPYFKEYFDKRNPHYRQSFVKGNFIEDLVLDGVFDLCVSIEVFEHIPHDVLLPFIQKMADHFRVLYFSSTPYRSSKKFDHEWGHCNVKTHEAWIKLFEANGFQYVNNPTKIVIWDALFVSRRLSEKKAKEVLAEEHLTQ